MKRFFFLVYFILAVQECRKYCRHPLQKMSLVATAPYFFQPLQWRVLRGPTGLDGSERRWFLYVFIILYVYI